MAQQRLIQNFSGREGPVYCSGWGSGRFPRPTPKFAIGFYFNAGLMNVIVRPKLVTVLIRCDPIFVSYFAGLQTCDINLSLLSDKMVFHESKYAIFSLKKVLNVLSLIEK